MTSEVILHYIKNMRLYNVSILIFLFFKIDLKMLEKNPGRAYWRKDIFLWDIEELTILIRSENPAELN